MGSDSERAVGAWLRRLPAWSGTGQYHLSRALFLRGLGLVYLAAFASLAVQIEGLVGARGILPAAEFVAALRQHLGAGGWLEAPTLLWVYCSDGALYALCWGGCLLALALVAGWGHWSGLLLLWAFYLSLTVVCRDFLAFQWDALLLETGFLAVFLAPRQWRPAWQWDGEPPRWVLYLLRFLLFRLMLSSGAVKLLSGDPAWSGLEALGYHFETQPLPAWTAWYAGRLPPALLQAGVVGVFFVELVVPFAFWGGARSRRWAAGLTALLQVGIAATGNYGFFNLLTAVLCLPLIDDSGWRRLWPRAPVPADARPWPRGLTWATAGTLGIMGGLKLAQTLAPSVEWPRPLLETQAALRPFRLANGYGLFAVMTTRRREIQLEASADGRVWRPYRMRYQPGAPDRPPAFIGLHMPRLDWQMWFAALGPYKRQRWFLPLMGRLLAAEPAVLALLAEPPLGEEAPRYVRARIADYAFSRPAERAAGVWWRIGPYGEYCPALHVRP